MNTCDFVQISDNWLDDVESDTTLEKGGDYFRQRLVNLTECEKEDDMLTLNAQVKSANSRKQYDVSISFGDDGEVYQYECNCPAYYNYDGPCKHCVATILTYNSFYVDSVVPKLRSMGITRQDSTVSPQTHIQPNRPAITQNSRGVFTVRPNGMADNESVSDYYARLHQEQIEMEQQRQAKIALQQTDNVLSAYKQIVVNEVKENGMSGQNRFVTLVPILEIDELQDGIFLSFQIRHRSEQEIAGGAQIADAKNQPDTANLPSADISPSTVPVNQFPRAYIVKLISEFMNATSRHENMHYGKELSFKAIDSAFDETSLRWLGFLQKRYNECWRITPRYGYGQKDRRMKLTDAALDELFAQFDDAWFRIGESSSEYCKLFSQEAPVLMVTLGNDDSGNVTLSCEQFRYVYLGEDSTNPREIVNERYGASWRASEKRAAMPPRHIYMVNEGQLRRFSASASRVIAPLLLGMIDSRGVLTFSPPQTADLFTHLLPEVSKYIKVHDPLGLIDENGADPMTGKVLLDAPNRESVTAILLSGYHGIWLDTHSGQAVGQTVENADGKSTSPVQMNWDVSGIDTSAIKRDYHAEQRFLATASEILGFKQDEILSFLSSDENGSITAGSPEQPIVMTDNDQIYKLLTQGVEKLQTLGDVLVTEKMRKLTVEPPKKIAVGVTLDSGLLKLSIDTGSIALDDLRELLRAYHEKKRYYRLKNGGFIDLNEGNEDAFTGIEELVKVEQGLQIDEDDLLNGAVEVPAFRAMYLDGLFSDAVSLGCSKDKAFQSLTERIKSFAHADYAIPESLDGVLRPYQKTGYQWLRCLESCSFCGILADDMGLGKSVQFISVLLSNNDEKDETLPSLIVCPSSLVLNWKKEIEKFAPSLPVRIVQGIASDRAKSIKGIQQGDIVVTSYDLLKRDVDSYKDIQFHCFAIDEAQYIKNHTTQAAKAVKKINCIQRFALTGTPVENRLSELWSIFDFLMPGYLYKYARFKEKFEQPITRDNDETARSNLRRMIMPFVLRRLKSEVLTELPPKTTSVVPVELCEKQMEIYNAMLLTGLQALKTDPNRPEGMAKMQILALLTRLRRLCCDPSLCFDTYKYESSKLEACMELLEQAREGGHRVLLFSQYTDMLDMIEVRVKATGMSYLRLQGSTAVKDRLDLVDTFNKGETDVFLISLKAGGTGLNLTAADTVIHYDPWWNTAAQDQATDRAHRIGQEKKVQVYKLIAQNTIEEKILKLQEMKKGLASIVEGENDEVSLMSMSTDDIVDLLKNR